MNSPYFFSLCLTSANPPYQEETKGAGNQATPLYNLFVDEAKNLNPKFLSMIIPSRWFAGGMGLEGFRETMKKDSKISHLVDYSNAKECFPAISISGGVCYFLRDRDCNSLCEVTNVSGGFKDIACRSLDEFDVLVRYNKGVNIIHKVVNKKESKLSDIVSPLMPFGFSTNFRGSLIKDKRNELLLHSSDGISYISREIVTKGLELIDKYKVLVSKTSSEHAGEPGKEGKFRVITSSTKVIGPNEICTHSYFVIGNFDSYVEAESALSYIRTNLVRFLMLLSMSSINLSKNSFTFVPAQDFTSNSDIDWAKPIPEIDQQLYKKYGLNEEEIAFIESMIRPME